MAKRVMAIVKLQIPAGKATPAPPVGPALSQYGIAIMEFVKAYNENSNPFAWTASADSILMKLGRLCKLISGTKH